MTADPPRDQDDESACAGPAGPPRGRRGRGGRHGHGHHGHGHHHYHHRHHRRRWRRDRGLRRYIRARLHRRIFVWFGASILITVAALSVLWQLADQRSPWRAELERAATFVGHRFADVWPNPAARDRLAASLAADMAIEVQVLDRDGAELTRAGRSCGARHYRIAVPVVADAPASPVLGELVLCRTRAGAVDSWVVIATLFLGGACLWVCTAFIARRLVRPLGELVRVARAIGAGRLDSRMRLSRRTRGEFRTLGVAINEMAARIEKQMSDQRALLAAVSHEIRTPLGHMRVLIDMARERAASERYLDELEREVLDVDSLVGQLLASSRLEFERIEPRPIDVRALAEEALVRAGADPSKLRVEVADTNMHGDPTLLARALANLIENAHTHGGDLSALRISDRAGKIAFEALDDGPGFDDDQAQHAFDSFYRGKPGSGHGALGLGLALVQRIASAHGGAVWAENRNTGGARVGFSVTRHVTEASPADHQD